jgi:hypothetical protein
LHVLHYTALFAVLAIPAVSVEKNEVVHFGLIELLFNSKELGHRGALAALFSGIHWLDPDRSLDHRFVLPTPLDAPPY